jgi:hypothetical protein
MTDYRSEETKQLAKKYRNQATQALTEDVIATREKTHGPYSKTAGIAQKLKEVMYTYGEEALPAMSPEQLESLDMICSKLARILSGNADEPDHWKDIAGYAELVVKNLENSSHTQMLVLI